jgi:hypothetical protein
MKQFIRDRHGKLLRDKAGLSRAQQGALPVLALRPDGRDGNLPRLPQVFLCRLHGTPLRRRQSGVLPVPHGTSHRRQRPAA